MGRRYYSTGRATEVKEIRVKRINVRITFLEEVLGTASANEELHATYIASKASEGERR